MSLRSRALLVVAIGAFAPAAHAQVVEPNGTVVPVMAAGPTGAEAAVGLVVVLLVAGLRRQRRR